MTYADEALIYQLIEFVMKAITFGILSGTVWGAVFRIKTRKGE